LGCRPAFVRNFHDASNFVQIKRNIALKMCKNIKISLVFLWDALISFCKLSIIKKRRRMICSI